MFVKSDPLRKPHKGSTMVAKDMLGMCVKRIRFAACRSDRVFVDSIVEKQAPLLNFRSLSGLV